MSRTKSYRWYFGTLVLLIVALGVSASTVSRSFSSQSIEQCQSLVVSLSVDITGGETFYAIDEDILPGWTVTDSGTGDTTENNHIKWIVIQDAANTVYDYTLAAPCNYTGTYNFTGRFMFEGQSTEQNITGNTLVNLTLPYQPPPASVVGNATTNLEFNYTVANQSNITNISGIQKVKFYDNEDVAVEFRHNFSYRRLNLKYITVEKQSNSSSYGSLLVKGVSGNKTIYIEHLGGNRLCILDKEVDSINAITSGCIATDEISIECDGKLHGNYTCTKEGSRYKIEGLQHSAVKEYTFEEDSSIDDGNDDDDDDDSSNTRRRSSGGSSGGSVSTNPPNSETKVSYYFSEIEDEVSKNIYAEDYPVTRFIIRTNKQVRAANVKMNRIIQLPVEISSLQNSIEYFEIDSDVDDNDISEVTIDFKVNRSFEEYDIILQRYHNNEWHDLPTKRMDEDSTYLYYQANSPGFSYFSINYEERGQAQQQEVEEEEPEEIIEEETSVVNQTSEPVQQPPKETKMPEFLIVILTSVLAAIILVVIFLRSRPRQTSL